jgi:hypothetical protein
MQESQHNQLGVYTFPHSQGIQYMPNTFSPASSFTGQKKLATLPGGRPPVLVLCFDITLLMLSIVFWTNGKKATAVEILSRWFGLLLEWV